MALHLVSTSIVWSQFTEPLRESVGLDQMKRVSKRNEEVMMLKEESLTGGEMRRREKKKQAMYAGVCEKK